MQTVEAEPRERPDSAPGTEGDDSGLTVHAMFEGQVHKTPASTAVVDRGKRYSYGAVNASANRWAHYLKKLGVGPEVLVGVCVERSIETVVGLLAVLKAGGAYVPLDPDYPAERLRYMLDNSGARVLLTKKWLLDRLPRFDGSCLCLDVDRPVASEPESAVVSAVDPGNLAYVIYTSGSTGHPKGAMIEHRSLVNYLTWLNRQFGIRGDDRVLATSSPSFDAFGIELYPALVAGGAVVMAEEGALNPGALLRTAVAEHVTMLALVPTTLRLLVDEPGLEACDEIRQVICGGEQLSGDLAARFAERLPVPLHNLYGPTEATIDVSFHTCWPADHVDGSVPIGRPIAKTQLHVLAENLDPMPKERPGHLHVGGMPVGRGYLQRPVETAEAFVPDPFGPPGSRLYRTGDLARWNSDGNLEFLGRLDQQVKVRGYRIELGEVEAALARHPAVRQCAVVVEPAGRGPQLVAYLVPAPGAMPTGHHLWSALREQLPTYMLPGRFVTLERMPVTSTGKVDRRALKV
jgi:amino acid adenylation domain-containing protein